MVAFTLVGLTPSSWQALEGPRPARRIASVVSGASPVARPAAPAPRRSEDAEPRDERVGAAAPAPAEEPAAPVERLPEELAPVAPDIVVAMELPRADSLRAPLAPAHTHTAEDADDGAGSPVALASPTGDDIQGPEPGALYWFGPRGLERIKVLGEGRR
jgi:hypothetical protein